MNLMSAIKNHNVRLVGEGNLLLQCIKCKAQWSPNIQPGGKLPSRYWLCPNGCNAEQRQPQSLEANHG